MTVAVIALLLVAHAIGDFLLQNHWMQSKSKNSFVCSVHVLVYSLPFLVLVMVAGLPVWSYWMILAQHWLQDRFALHLRWMRLYRQTPPELWPAGPLFVDQAWHIAFLGLIGFVVDMH